MKTYNLENKPENLTPFRKKGISYATFITEPFVVEMQEGVLLISPETVNDWDGGYWLVYPSDGSKPYAWSNSFKIKNMEEIL